MGQLFYCIVVWARENAWVESQPISLTGCGLRRFEGNGGISIGLPHLEDSKELIILYHNEVVGLTFILLGSIDLSFSISGSAHGRSGDSDIPELLGIECELVNGKWKKKRSYNICKSTPAAGGEG